MDEGDRSSIAAARRREIAKHHVLLIPGESLGRPALIGQRRIGERRSSTKRRSFHITFLWRFTLVTFVVSLLSALCLAYAIEKSHRLAIENGIERAALERVGQELKGPLDNLAPYDPLDATRLHALEHARDDAGVFQYVTDMRVYRHTGEAVFPLNGTPESANVQRALASDSFVRVDHGATITTYSAYFTSSEQAYVLAVDFSQRELGEAYAPERRDLFRIIGTVVAIIILSLLMLAAGASRELEVRRRQAQSTFVQALQILAEVIDLRDPYTAGHSMRVAAYSRKLALAVGLPLAEVDAIESGALLHDIGKIAIPDAVLFKPAALDPDERRIIETHPVVGSRLLGHISSMEDVIPCVLQHHEKIDGSGYPDHLVGDAIAVGARVVAVADAFDAMTTDRPYRRAMSAAAAVAELVRVAGTQLDERYVYAFAELVRDGAIVPPPPRANDEAAFDARYRLQMRAPDAAERVTVEVGAARPGAEHRPPA